MAERAASVFPAPEQSERPRSLWRNRDYLLLWSGQLVSATGSSASQIAFPLLVLFLTGSAAQAGIVGGLLLVPYLFLSLPAGALVDRWDRKRVMILCDSVRAVNMASIPLASVLGHLSLLQLYAVALIEGSFFVFFNIAEVAALPQVVSREQLPEAMAQNQMLFMVATLAGPPAGGALYQAVGRAMPFLADAVSFAGSALSLAFIRRPFQQERAAGTRDLRREILEGLHWLWQQRTLRAIAALMGMSSLLTGGGYLLLIVLSRRLGASPAAIGTIIAVASVGGILGALCGPQFQRRLPFAALVIGFLWIQAFLFLPFAVAGNLTVLTLGVTALFFTLPILNVALISYRLALIPDHLQGRVNSVYRLVLFAPSPASQALTGLSIQHFGVRPTLFIVFGGLVLLAAAATLSRDLRRTQSPVPSA